VDADWAGNPDNHRSTSGYLFVVCGGIVSWSCKKQQTISLSSTESELAAAKEAIKEAVWSRYFLKEIGFFSLFQKPTVIYEDNQGCINVATNPIFHARMKHIAVHHGYIRERIINGDVELVWCDSHYMVADMLTKAIPKGQLMRILDGIGLVVNPYIL
jgi:hypothetical protein